MAPPTLLMDVAWPVQASHVPVTRRSLLEALPAGTSSDLEDDAALLLTEVVTNVVLHSGTGPDDEFMVRLFGTDERLRIEVEDAGAGFDVPQPLPLDNGFGLRMVQRLSAAWGIRPGRRPPTVMWFELPTHRASAER